MEKNKPIFYQEQALEKNRPVRVSAYKDEIIEHMKRCFPDRKETVFHENISDLLQVDIHMLEAPTMQDVHVIYTVGMSALPMALPAEQPQELRFAEMILLLPAEWKLEAPVSENEKEDGSVWWPVTLLKYLARFPHECQTWLGWGHIVSNSAAYLPYDETTGFCGTMIGALQEEVSVFCAKDGTQLNLYVLIPLYKEEMQWKQEKGITSLLEKLSELTGYGMVIFPDRPNVCAK